MKILQEILSNLETAVTGQGYPYSDIPGFEDHKIGLNESGCPIFFLKCDQGTLTGMLPYHLEMIDIHFQRDCELQGTSAESSVEKFSTIALKDGYQQLSDYYLEIIYLMLGKLPKHFKADLLRSEIGKIIHLFTTVSAAPIKSVQGLWAELFIIERASDPAHLIRAWHRDTNELYDFNDGETKLEVKSTRNKCRTHTFSLDQLRPNEQANLVIASVMVLPAGLGENIFDLKNRIQARLRSSEDQMKLHEMISLTLGSSLPFAEDDYFDYGYSVDKLLYFDYLAVPCVERESVPSEINDVSFQVNLSNIEESAMSMLTGRMGKSIF